jgi:hypothetical protein
VRLLTFPVLEPIPGTVFPEMVPEYGTEEAARRYRATVVTTLRQLRGLSDARIRLRVTPEDGHEALRFWLLPRLADRWQAEGEIFRTDGWEIDFGGTDEGFPIHAWGEILCPHLGARWVHTALLGLGRTTHQVLGPTPTGGTYFSANSLVTGENLEPRILPELSVIRTHDDWLDALSSALGPALKRAWEEEKS